MLNNKVKALEVALLALDIAKACQAIHKHNIIHGDLKPHNVLLTGDTDDERGWIGKIADFGLSVKIKRGEQHVSGIQHGTEGYVAPEVLQTRRMVKASDVYSFGIIMWEMWHARLYYEEYRHAQRRMCVPPQLVVFGFPRGTITVVTVAVLYACMQFQLGWLVPWLDAAWPCHDDVSCCRRVCLFITGYPCVGLYSPTHMTCVCLHFDSITLQHVSFLLRWSLS